MYQVQQQMREILHLKNARPGQRQEVGGEAMSDRDIVAELHRWLIDHSGPDVRLISRARNEIEALRRDEAALAKEVAALLKDDVADV